MKMLGCFSFSGRLWLIYWICCVIFFFNWTFFYFRCTFIISLSCSVVCPCDLCSRCLEYVMMFVCGQLYGSVFFRCGFPLSFVLNVSFSFLVVFTVLLCFFCSCVFTRSLFVQVACVFYISKFGLSMVWIDHCWIVFYKW